jgi:hypothetical protein
MKKVIDGLLYDTESATEVAYWHNGKLPGDFHRAEETLYRTPNGRWFLHGKGGAMSDYRRPAGDGFRDGEEIRALTKDEAQAWLERHDKIHALEKWFSDEIEPA